MIIITGQTATGKTDLALEYAVKYNGELINCDSRQIYKHLDIITGKDVPDNSKFRIQDSKSKFQIGYYPVSGTKIWLYDIIEPDRYFSSFDFVSCADFVISDIQSRGKTPIIVGGSYFYLKHFLYGLGVQVPPNFQLRKKLNEKNVIQLQQLILNIDRQIKQTFNNSDWNNPRRLIRRIEILQGKVPERTLPERKLPEKYIGLRYKNRLDLVAAIKNRVERRLKAGAINEVEKILSLGYKKFDFGLKTIGYQQIIKYLSGDLSLEKAVDEWTSREVQYAKRQYTFMKTDKNITWKEQ